MSNKREPLLSEAQMRDMVTCGLKYVDEIRMIGAVRVNSWHEAARAKDEELIQRLVDVLARLSKSVKRAPFDTLVERDLATAAAEAAGFKPTEQ